MRTIQEICGARFGSDGNSRKLHRTKREHPARVHLEELETRRLLSAVVGLDALRWAAAGPAGAPTVSIARVRDASETKGSSAGQFKITRKGGDPSTELTVNYLVDAASTATAGDDYGPLSGVVMIPAGKTSVLVSVWAVDDALGEGKEMLVVDLAAGSGYGLNALPARQTASVAILDNESVVSITRTRQGSEKDGAMKGAGAFTVTRKGGDQSAPLTVNYTVNPASTATAGADYMPLNGNVVIPAGKSFAAVVVPIIDDDLAESSETLMLDLAADPAYSRDTSPARQTASITIADNEGIVSIVKTRDGSEASGLTAGSGQFTVSRRGGNLAQPLAVHYVVDGASSACAGVDYQALSGIAVIPAGKTSACIDVCACADTENESAETVTLMLQGDDAYHLGATPALQSATLKINNVLGVNFLDILGFNAVGSSWLYQAWTSYGVSGTAEKSVVDSSGSYQVVTKLNSQIPGVVDQVSQQLWASGNDGLRFQSIHESVGGDEIDVTFADLLVAPPILSGTYTGTSPIQLSLSGIGDFTGTSKVTTAVLGMTEAVVPAGTYEAVKITMTIDYNVSGTIYSGGTGILATMHGVDTETFYAVQGVGVVKSSSTMNVSIRVPGYGGTSSQDTMNSALISYTYIPPTKP